MTINQPIPKEIIDKHFRYFFPSLVCFRERYFPLMFQTKESVERHIAYVCPLCTENYLILKKEGLFATSEFSREDFPPQNVGGSNKVLTCKICNNKAGYKFDHELVKEVERRAISYNAKIKIENIQGYYNGSIKQIKKGIFAMDFPDKLKKKAAPLKEWLEYPLTPNEFQIQIKTEPVNNIKVAKALLKTAYLFCFLNWGYDFIFSTNAERLRDFLYDDEKDPSFLIAFWLDSTNHKLNEIPQGLCAIKKPSDLTPFIVNIPIKREGYEGIASVLIPKYGEESWNKVLDIKQHFQNNPNLEITFAKHISAMDNKCYNGYSSETRNS